MRLVEDDGADDERSMAANNTSAFNCRGVPGSTSWSEYAYGRAIDINPVQNQEIRDGVVSPAAGERCVDRSLRRRGMIRPGDRSFARSRPPGGSGAATGSCSRTTSTLLRRRTLAGSRRGPEATRARLTGLPVG
jgi:hypothetical protein